MITAMQDIAKSAKSKKDTFFYDDCAEELKSIEDSEFEFMQQEFRVIYDMVSCEYKIPYVTRSQIPLDSRIMTIEPSENIKAPYVIAISNMLDVGGGRIVVPLNTTKHSIHKINTHKMAGMGIHIHGYTEISEGGLELQKLCITAKDIQNHRR